MAAVPERKQLLAHSASMVKLLTYCADEGNRKQSYSPNSTRQEAAVVVYESLAS